MEPKVLEILEVKKSGLKLDTKAFNSVLDKVGNIPLVIFSTTGEPRSGKSYLLNHFIRYFQAQKPLKEKKADKWKSQNWMDFPLKSGFKSHQGKDPLTKGMNLWSEPYFVNTTSGPVGVLLMDIQGLEDNPHDHKNQKIISFLTNSCSSVVIFNVMKQANDNHLQKIYDFSQPDALTNQFLADKSVFQNLLLVVRDFEMPGHDHGLHEVLKKPEGDGDNFMRDTFHLDGPPQECPVENSKLRNEILGRFDDVSVYLLPEIGKKFLHGKGNPDEEFQEELKSFIEHMTSSEYLVKKKVNGRPCTGEEFKHVVGSWAELIQPPRKKLTLKRTSKILSPTLCVHKNLIPMEMLQPLPLPLPLLQMTKDKIRLNESAFNSVLDKVGNKPILVFCITGPTRSGKSSLLNYFIRYFEYRKKFPNSIASPNSSWINQKAHEFPTRNGVGNERTTIGIDLWSEPYLLPTSSGEEVAILLMDTQGIFDDKTTVRQNAIIFSLSLLCSSCMIFNQMHTINEDFLKKIQFFSHYANEVSSKSAISTEDVFQKLLFVNRDFYHFQYDHECHDLDSIIKPTGNKRNYFKDTFQFQPPNRPFKEESLVRKSILEMFESVAIFPLPDPGEEFKRQSQLQSQGRTKPAEPEPVEEFLESVKTFVEWIFSEKNLQRKKVSDRFVSGLQFKKSILDWASVCTKAEDTFPRLPTLARSVAYTHHAIAKHLAFTFYVERMEEQVKIARDIAQLNEMESDACKKSMEIFRRASKVEVEVEDENDKLNLKSLLQYEIKKHCKFVTEMFGVIARDGETGVGHRDRHRRSNMSFFRRNANTNLSRTDRIRQSFHELGEALFPRSNLRRRATVQRITAGKP